MAINLDQAWQGFPNETRFKLAALEARDHLLSLSSTQKNLPIQATAYKSLMQVGFPNDIQAHVSKHLFQYLGVDVDKHTCLDLSECFKQMRKLRKHEAMQVMKTWCNSWTTSYRYHEEVLHPCLLGCPGMKDDLAHYVNCPHIWFVARTAFPNLKFDSMFDRLCVENPCTESLRVLAGTFPAYHTIKPSNCEARASFDSARRDFAPAFCTAVRASGFCPAAPAHL